MSTTAFAVAVGIQVVVLAAGHPQSGSDPCFPNPCGPGATCQRQGGNRAICTCPPGWLGDPTSSCRPECSQLSDCPLNRQCQIDRCVDPCLLNIETGRPPCGAGAICEAARHKAICSCPKSHTGDPFVSCRPFTSDDLCDPAVNIRAGCGANAYCEPGFDKLTGEERPVCLCNPGYVGNGVTGCTRGECTSLQHHTCPDDRACYDSTCIDPCSSTFCGGGPCCAPTATCRGRDHKAECSCPPGTDGDPRVDCRPSTGAIQRGAPGAGGGSLCEPNPCGTGAICAPGSDVTGKARPVCTCPKGYSGNALDLCRRGECFHDDECSSRLACIDFRCQDPCLGVCGSNAQCQVRNHGPVCSCPAGYQGDPLTHCFLAKNG